MIAMTYVNIIVRESLWLIFLPNKISVRRILVEPDPAFKFLRRCHCDFVD